MAEDRDQGPAKWRAFISHCEDRIDELRRELAPLESGDVQTAKRGRDSGGQWKETTDDEIKRLKEVITHWEHVIAVYWYKAGR
jgi:hypothetical protein